MRNVSLKALSVSAALLGALALGACGGGGSATPSGSGDIAIGTVGEEFKFDSDGITLKAGQPVKVTFKNNSASSQHNWVLVKGGEDVAAKIDQAGIVADSAKGYVPDDPDVVAHTKLVEGGQSDTTTFTAPGPGTYVYLCTFPGHYGAGMKGAIVVQP